MNHALNAEIHKLPYCPECNAQIGKPCTTVGGYLCAPHRIRGRIIRGEIEVTTKTEPETELLDQLASEVHNAVKETAEVISVTREQHAGRGGFTMLMIFGDRKFGLEIADLGHKDGSSK